MVLYFAETTDRSKFACNFSSSFFSFFSSVHISIKSWKCWSVWLDLTVPTTASLKSRPFVFLNFLSIIPSHPSYWKVGKLGQKWREGTRADCVRVQNRDSEIQFIAFYNLVQTRAQSLFMCFWGERRLRLSWGARGLMGRDKPSHKSPRTSIWSQPPGTQKHINSNWVRVTF